MAAAVPAATGENVDLAYVDQGYTGAEPAAAPREHGIALAVVKLPEAERGFVLLPRLNGAAVQRVAERTFAWTTRFRRLPGLRASAPDLADLHVVALVCLMLRQAANYAAVHSSL